MSKNKRKTTHTNPGGAETTASGNICEASSPTLFPPEFYHPPLIDEFARTGNDTGKRFGIWDLAAVEPGNYRKLFELAQVPRLDDFYGHTFNGMSLYIRYWFFGRVLYSLYVGRFRDVLTGKMFSQPFTFQKRFLEQDLQVKKGTKEGGVSGTNYWCRQGQVFLPFRIYISPGFGDATSDSLKIDYNVLPNKAFFKRPLIDEVKQIPGTNLYLGRMYFRLCSWRIPFLWFALEKNE